MQARSATFAPNKFTNAIQHSTISLTWFRSGVGDPPKINVIPSVAEAGLDCRVLPGTTRDQWIAEVTRRLGDPALEDRADQRIRRPGRHARSDTPLYRNLEAAIKRRHPDAIVTPILIPYGTDSNAFRPERRQELRHLSGDPLGRHRRVDARRRRACPLSGVSEAAQVFFEALRDTVAR